MAVEPIRYAPTLGSAETSRTPSNAIWKDCPWGSIVDGISPGMTFFDDFLVAGNADMTSAYKNGIGQWSCYGYAGAQINDAQKEGGVIKMSSDGDNEGLTLLGSAGGFQFIEANSTTAPVPHKKMWFEARIAKSSIASAHLTAFVGLMAPTLSSGLPAAAQPLTTTDDVPMTAGDLFGFLLSGTTSTNGGPTEVGVTFVKASGTVNYPTNLQTLMASTGNTVLAADTYVKIGFVYEPTPICGPRAVSSATARQTAGNIRNPLIRFFVNGLEAPAFLASDDLYNATSGQAFPIAKLAPVLSIMNMASQSSDYLAVDWIKVAQYSYT